ncbi:MAG TPA: DUF1289 domain-containing protein [Oxalicibacterium sp.]|nr:DUF1289 domain-containing protein [Oxalicibacterium sp.]
MKKKLLRRKEWKAELEALLARVDLHDSPLPSPCIGVCRIDARTALCEGCLRTRDEIAQWGVFDDANRRTVWQAIGRRHRDLSARRRWFFFRF